jgi:hypothetical protein
MFEKADLKLQADPSMPTTPLNGKDDSPQPPRRNTSHPTMWKLSYTYCCYVVAAWLHNAAIVSAQEVYRARWNEVINPNVNLVDWVKLLMVRDFGYPA